MPARCRFHSGLPAVISSRGVQLHTCMKQSSRQRERRSTLPICHLSMNQSSANPCTSMHEVKSSRAKRCREQPNRQHLRTITSNAILERHCGSEASGGSHRERPKALRQAPAAIASTSSAPRQAQAAIASASAAPEQARARRPQNPQCGSVVASSTQCGSKWKPELK